MGPAVLAGTGASVDGEPDRGVALVAAVAVGAEVGEALGADGSAVGVEAGSGLEAGIGVPVAVVPQEMTKASKSAGIKARRAVNILPPLAQYAPCRAEASVSVGHVRVNQAVLLTPQYGLAS